MLLLNLDFFFFYSHEIHHESFTVFVIYLGYYTSLYLEEAVCTCEKGERTSTAEVNLERLS